MKRIGFLTLLVVWAMSTTKAQEMGAFYGDCGLIIAPNAKLSTSGSFNLMWKINDSWMVGVDANLQFLNFSNPGSIHPFNHLCMSIRRYGGGGLVRYDLPTKRHRQFLMLKTNLAYNNILLSANDSRYVYEYSSESGDEISHTFYLYNSQEKRWGRPFMISMELSYNFHLFKGLAFSFTLGCDLMNNFSKTKAQIPTKITAGWEDFEEYYGDVTINPYEEISLVKKACTRPLCYCGVSIKLGGSFKKKEITWYTTSKKESDDFFLDH